MMCNTILEIYDRGGVKSSEFLKAMIRLEKTMEPSLSLRGINIKNYSQKLMDCAELLILRGKEDIVGISAFYANNLQDRTAYLSFIAIMPDIVGLGLGRKLLDESEKRAMALGMGKMELEVLKNNLHAIDFYKKMGYTDYGKSSDHSKYMVKNLG